MSTVVLKYVVEPNGEWHPLPAGKIVHVGEQSGNVTLWIEVHGACLDHEDPDLTQEVCIFGTGQTLPEKSIEHVGTAIVPSGSGYTDLVWHVYKAARSS